MGWRVANKERRVRVGFISNFFFQTNDHASVKMVEASISALPVDRVHVALLAVADVSFKDQPHSASVTQRLLHI